MARQDYFPTTIGDQSDWLQNFKANLPTYVTVLDLVPAEVEALLLDVDNAYYALASYRIAISSFHDAAFKLIEEALMNTQMVGVIEWPDFIAPTPVPAAVSNGCLRRIFDYCNNVIKKSPRYTKAIGAGLGLLPRTKTAPDPNIAPKLTLRQTSGARLEVVWTKGPFNGLRLEFDLGADGSKGDIALLTRYVFDWMPATGISAIIRVRGRYLYKGEDFGTWSPWQNWTLTGH